MSCRQANCTSCSNRISTAGRRTSSGILLRACASPIEELEKANQQRESEFQIVLNSYRIRSIVYDAVVIIREDASLSDDALLKTTQQSHPDASMANVKEARRVSKEDTAVTSPKEPRAAAPMEPYQALYF